MMDILNAINNSPPVLVIGGGLLLGWLMATLIWRL